MSSERDNRQRAAARAKLEREMAARQAAARRKRLLQARIGGGVAAALVVGAIIWVVVAVSGGSSTPTTTASQPTGCVWKPQPTPPAAPGSTPEPTAKPVSPPSTTVPRTGFQQLTFTTNRGVIRIEMDLSKTPCTAASMANLVAAQFYNGSSCHRLVVDIAALQCGDPTGTGTGGPGYQFADENLPTGKVPTYQAGDVAMANSGPGTNGSQFFFIWKATGGLQANYSLWGHVTEGLNIIAGVGAAGDDGAFASGGGGGHPKLPVKIISVTAGPVTPTSQATSAPAPAPAPTTSAAATPSTKSS